MNRKLKTGVFYGTVAALLTALAAPITQAAGMLHPKGSASQPIKIMSHEVNVTINNGFAQTEVMQTFYNPNPTDLEGIYSCPLPKTASLSEMTIWAGERKMDGEVLTKEDADRIYEEEKAQGNDAGKAQKNSIQTFEFYVHPIRASAETRVRYVYYQPLKIDTGVGRYVYPLENGGTDEVAHSFWTQNKTVEGEFIVNLTLKSAYPVIDTRAPGYEGAATIEKRDENTHTLTMKSTQAELSRDFVFYYRLADDLPGRVEVIPYRADADKPGKFMMVVTPGIDLKPLTQGADYIYVLDTSGSMSGGKIQTLADGVKKAIGGMRPEDRFRVIAFNNRAREITSGWVAATPENIRREVDKVTALTSNGGTNIHDALKKALTKLDADRATSVVLVTDGVTNVGVVDPKSFHEMLKQYDVRVFGFVMGNSANWPLMNIISKTSGGFAAGVSNDDDIVGQIMLAKSKITHESMHDAHIDISGVKVFDTTDQAIGKIYRGQQLVLFGQYKKGGKAKVTLKASLTGEDKEYTTVFDFPDIATENPEIERLWALNQIEQHAMQAEIGVLPIGELKDIQKQLGVEYQLVTDETTMIVLPDEVYAQRGIERRNQVRVANERAAQSARAAQPVQNYTVSQNQNTFPARAPRIGGGGAGALGPVWILGAAALIGISRVNRKRREG